MTRAPEPAPATDAAAEHAARRWLEGRVEPVRFGGGHGNHRSVSIVRDFHAYEDGTQFGILLIALDGGRYTGEDAKGDRENRSALIAVPHGVAVQYDAVANPKLTVRFLSWVDLKALYEREKPHGDYGPSSMTGGQYSG